MLFLFKYEILIVILFIADIDISETSVAHLLATNSNHYYVKCVDIYPRKEPDMLLAIGQANGKVILTTFSAIKLESLSGFNNLEFGKILYIFGHHSFIELLKLILPANKPDRELTIHSSFNPLFMYFIVT